MLRKDLLHVVSLSILTVLFSLAHSDWSQAKDPKFCDITLTSSTSGAEVYMEGFYLGKTPLVIEDLFNGRSVRIVLKKEGYRDNVQDIEVDFPAIDRYHVDLEECADCTQFPTMQFIPAKSKIKSNPKSIWKGVHSDNVDTYRHVIVGSSMVSPGIYVPNHFLQIFYPKLVDELCSATRFDTVSAIYTKSGRKKYDVSHSVPHEKTMLLNATILTFKRGSSGRRYGLGNFGAGSSKVVMSITATDYQTGEILFSKLHESVVSGGGLFGALASNKSIMTNSASEMVSRLEKAMKKSEKMRKKREKKASKKKGEKKTSKKKKA
ncbi:PEGA domain-containing protein [Acidobacteriota bacterium]